MTQCCSGQLLFLCLSSGVLSGLLESVELAVFCSREFVCLAAEGDRNKNLGKEELKFLGGSFSFLCYVYTLVWLFFFSIIVFSFLFVYFRNPISFHFA